MIRLYSIVPTYFLFGIMNMLFCQANYDHVWLHGYTAYEPWPEFFIGIKLDFNKAPMEYGYYEKKSGFRYSSTSISDSLGNLLFYTNGCEIYDADHQLVEDSYPLAPSRMHEVFCKERGENFNGHARGYVNAQMISAVPNLRREDSYLIFLGQYQFNPSPPPVIMGSIAMAEVVRIEGKLRVVNKTPDILKGDLSANVISLVKHANGLDWWLLTFEAVTNRYFSLLIRDNEVVHIESDTIGQSFQRTHDGWGQINISPNGKKVVRHSPIGGTMLFDFDRETGRLSNDEFFHLGDDPVWANVFGSAGFSPDNKLLYVGTITQVFQIELDAPDKVASAILVGQWDGFFYEDFWNVDFYQMQNAPDCKIYMIPTGAVPFIHTIHNPNVRGMGCNFEQRAIVAPEYSVYPTHLNYPNYRLSTPWEDWCEEGYVSSSETTRVAKSYEITPNPAADIIRVKPVGKESSERVEIEMVDLQGRVVARLSTWLTAEGVEFPVQSLQNGLYSISIKSTNSIPFTDKMVIIK